MTENIYKQFETIKSKLARSIKEILTKDAAPPAGERPVDYDVAVPYNQIAVDDDETEYAKATVIYTVLCPGEKKHVVRIKFKYEKTGKFLKDTMLYV